jgi:hypothetical protein
MAPIPSKLCRTLKLEHYAADAMTEFVPPAFDWAIGVPDFMDLNDRLGDCVVAGMAKTVRSWVANLPTGPQLVTITDDQILDVYKKGAGYNPADPSTDQGWDLLSALSYWQRIGIAGHKIGAYAAVNPAQKAMPRAALFLFGGLYVAFDLPASIWDQMDAGKPWDVVSNDGGSIGGHCVTIQGIAPNGNLICLTWGQRQEITWAFFAKYCFEAYAIISQEYLSGGLTVSGLDIARLTKDLALVKAD